MPKAKKSITKVADKLEKVSESFTVNTYDNGYMIEVSGRDSEGDWKTAKIMVQDIEQLIALVREITELERDE